MRDAVEAEVAALPEHLRSSPEASLCLLLAERLGETTPRDAATVSKELRAALAALREVVKAAGNRGDRVDELRARRAARSSGKAAPAAKAARGKQ